MEYPRIEMSGEWWDANDEKIKASGRFDFTREDGGILDLIGSLRGPDYGVEYKQGENGEFRGEHNLNTAKKAREYKRIIGKTPSGFVTLEDCNRISASGNPLEFKKETIASTWAFSGVRFEPAEDLAFDQFSLHLGNLTRWTAKSGLNGHPIAQLKKFGHTFGPEKENSWYEIHALTVEKMTFALSNGWEVSIAQDLAKSGDGIHEIKLTQEFFFSAKHPELRPIEEIFELVSDLQDLITISSTGASAIRKLTLRHPNVTRGPKNHRKNIDFHGRWNFPNPASPEVSDKRNQTYFTLEDLGGVEGISRWLEFAGCHRLKISRALAGRYFSGMLIEDRILNAASALESLDKKIKNDNVQDLKVRLNRLQTLAGYPFTDMVNDSHSWSMLVKSYRNESAHNFEKLVDTDSTRKYWIAISTYWLFVICMMREAGLPESSFESLANNQDFIFHATRIRQLDLS